MKRRVLILVVVLAIVGAAAGYWLAGPGLDRTTTVRGVVGSEKVALFATGRDLVAFRTFHSGLPAALRTVPVFTLLFGENNVAEMGQIAELTGGRTFDARVAPLAEVFKEIRGYQ